MQSVPERTRMQSVSKRTRSKLKQTPLTDIDVPKKTRRKERVDCAAQTDQLWQLTFDIRTRGKRKQRSSGSMLENLESAEDMLAAQQPEISTYSAEGDQRVSVDHDETLTISLKSNEIIEAKPDGSAAGCASAEGDRSVSPVDADREYEDKEEKSHDVLCAPSDKLGVVETHGDGAVDEGSSSSVEWEPHIEECSSPRDGTCALKQKDKMDSNIRNAVSANDATAAATPDNAVSPLAEAATPDENAKLPSSDKLPEAAATTPVSPMAEKGSVVTELPDVSAFKIRPDNLVCAPPGAETDGSRAAAPEQEARFRGSFDTSPIDMTQFTIVSAVTFVEIHQRMKDNTEVIRKVAKERETLMELIQGKTRENDMLSSLMIELSDKQALKSEELAWEYASMNKELEKARNMKREMVRMYARIMGEVNLECDVPKNQRAKTAVPRRDAESCPEGKLPLSEAAARLISNAMDHFNEHIDCATSIQLTAPSNIAPAPFGEAMSGSADIAEVVEEAATVIPPEPLGEAVPGSADVAEVGEAAPITIALDEAVPGCTDVAEVGETSATIIASEPHGESVPGSADVVEIGETATTIIASKPLGEAMSGSVAGSESVAGSSDVTEVGEAVTGSNASLLRLLSPFLTLLAEVGEAAAGR